LHPLHLPRSASHENTGMFSYQGNAWPHRGHFERGRTMLSPAGTRAITTLRKLPMQSPVRPSQTIWSHSRKLTGSSLADGAVGGSKLSLLIALSWGILDPSL
jgi:hypothetical protein